ncbi:MAG: type II secretion system protein [Candidatus Nomurabacteria bacterium]|nr:type II secretion system protein [Candidatus Nomurabacteria bacterium]
MNLNNKQKNRGMTLVELMVVLAIMSIISAIVVTNYSGYKSSNSIKITADDIALSVRQAQAFAIGVRSTSSDVFPGYGIHFDTFDSGSVVNVEVLPECSDHKDNDADMYFDIGDPSCHSDFDTSNASSYNPDFNDESRKSQCSDGLDNDGDGSVDIDDPQCHTDSDSSNFGSYNPLWDNESSRSTLGTFLCSNGIDDDSDGQIDYNDPDCHIDKNNQNINSYNKTINSEGNSTLNTGSGDAGGGGVVDPNIGPAAFLFNNLSKKIAQNISSELNNFLKNTTPSVFADGVLGSISGNSNSFILFADIPCGIGDQKGNNQYDYPNTSSPTPCGGSSASTGYVCDSSSLVSGYECLNIFNTPGTDKIVGLCVNDECENSMLGSKGTLDIVFNRPNPDANFCFRILGSLSSGCSNNSAEISHAGIIVQSSIDERTKKVIIYSTGQISVE